ncbi:MAG: aminoglycoside phosphotransferase family protein [Massiliimalia sp.]|jgi:spectinomycin phosphotransferase
MIPISDMQHVLTDQYGLSVQKIISRPGGTAALAYEIVTPECSYFCKAYDKSAAFTQLYTRFLKEYLDVSLWLRENTHLGEAIVCPVATCSGSWYYETQHAKYVLFPFCSGEHPPFGGELQAPERRAAIARALYQLHQAVPPAEMTVPFRETFAIPFYEAFLKMLHHPEILPEDAKKLTLPHIQRLLELSEELMGLSHMLMENPPAFVWCHTDLHGGNMLWNNPNLWLLDWESIRFAPPEADLFLFSVQPEWEDFLREYNPDYLLNTTALRFYCVRRKLEDVWEFLERLRQEQSCFGDDRNTILNYVEKEYRTLL